MRVTTIVFTTLAFFSIMWANKSLAQIEELIRINQPDSARILLEIYNEENLFNPATYLGGMLAKGGKDAFVKFKSLKLTSMDNEKKQKALYEIAHYYYITGSPGMAIAFFRKSILSHQVGELAQKSHYWMGILCLQYGLKKIAYLDSADAHFRYLVDLEPRNNWYPLGLSGVAQVRIIKKDFISGKTVLNMAAEKVLPEDLATINYFSWVLAVEQGDSTSQQLYAAQLHAYSPEWLETGLVPYAKLPDSLADSTLHSSGVLLTEMADSSEHDFEINKNKLHDSTLSIQLAAFTIKENANEYLQKLDTMNINAHIVKKLRKEMEYFLIRIVGFVDRESAEGFAETNLVSRGISYYLVYPN